MKKILIALALVCLMAVSVSAWYGSDQHRFAIDCAGVDTGTPIVINGSSGFTIDGETQIAWTQCRPDLYLYYSSSTDYLVADNESIRYPMEVEKGNGTSYLPRDVWGLEYLAVYHFGDLSDSSQYDNDLQWSSAQFCESEPCNYPTPANIGDGMHFGESSVRSTNNLGIVGSTPRTILYFLNTISESNAFDYEWSIGDYGDYMTYHHVLSLIQRGNTGSKYVSVDNFQQELTINPTVPERGQSFFTIFTYDGTTASLYYDTIFNGSVETEVDTTPNLLSIGIAPEGSISDNIVRVYDEFRFLNNTNMTDAQMQQLYANFAGTATYGTLGEIENAPAAPPAPTGYVAQYSTQDYKDMVIDFIGGGAAEFVGWVGMLVLVGVIGYGISRMRKAGGK